MTFWVTPLLRKVVRIITKFSAETDKVLKWKDI